MSNVTFLSGGTGTPKLLWGAMEVLDQDEISVVVNTGDDVVISGNLVCPDIDSVLYTLSGLIDRDKWWGIRNDTFETHDEIVGRHSEEMRLIPSARRYGENRTFSGRGEFMAIGDRDRATHIYRTSLLDEGCTLTAATKELTDSLGIDAGVLPMSDDPVATYLDTSLGEMHFQEFWVGRGGEPEIKDVYFKGIDSAEPTESVLDALGGNVVIGPSNPITSISPMLELPGFRDALVDSFVVAVSPFVGGGAVSGPADELMRCDGFDASSQGMYEVYREFVDVVVCSEDFDAACDVMVCDTMIDGLEDSVSLVRSVLEVLS